VKPLRMTPNVGNSQAMKLAVTATIDIEDGVKMLLIGKTSFMRVNP